jgi:hypothetical protein
LHKKDRALLEQIKSFFGVGKVTNSGKDAVTYRVTSIKDIEVIVNHFDKFPLLTKKWADGGARSAPTFFFVNKKTINFSNKSPLNYTNSGLKPWGGGG